MAESDASATKKEEKFLNKTERKKCWSSRDEYWACLDKCVTESDTAGCQKAREAYTADCPPTWVNHFDRKYRYEKFKVLLKSEGFQEAADEEFMKKKKNQQ